ncbi:Cell surface protein, partial [Liquorilactobacillus mali KCTC 3596 = DSM 20444]
MASQASIKAKNSTITVGPKTSWNATDNLVSATDA